MTHTSSESKFHLDGFLPLPLTCLLAQYSRLTLVVSVDISARALHSAIKSV